MTELFTTPDEPVIGTYTSSTDKDVEQLTPSLETIEYAEATLDLATNKVTSYVLEEEPVSAEINYGDFWIDTSDSYRLYVYSTNAWKIEADLNSVVKQNSGFGASSSSTVSTGGYVTPPGDTPYRKEETEKYNGISWSMSGDLNLARAKAASCGIESAGLVLGTNGNDIESTESFDGSSWTTKGNTTIGGYPYRSMFGTVSSAVYTGTYYDNHQSDQFSFETFNGSNWSAGGYITHRLYYYPMDVGIASAGFAIGSKVIWANIMANYNGSSWSVGATANVMRTDGYKAGNTSNALLAGGYYNHDTMESYNGSSWSVMRAVVNGDVYDGGCSGSTSSFMIFGGSSEVNEARSYPNDGWAKLT